MTYRAPELLGPAHQLDAFARASAEQTDWLVGHARQSMATATTTALVVSPGRQPPVVACYAWTMAQLDSADPHVAAQTHRPLSQPVALLARLGCTATTNDTARAQHCWAMSSCASR